MDRDEIVRRFERWLDEALAAADPPAGVDAEILESLAVEGGDEPDDVDARGDAYAVWAAVTALTQEVKLQGRAFKELSDGLGAQPNRIAEEIRAAHVARERDVQREAERRCRREILGTLVDLRDRLERGLDAVRGAEAERARAATRGWWVRVWARPAGAATADQLAALTRGYELSVERLDQTLDEFGARRIGGEGEPFDPRRMNAIDRAEAGDVPGGTVLEVYRSGYEWNGDIVRPAQVKVSCEPRLATEN